MELAQHRAMVNGRVEEMHGESSDQVHLMERHIRPSHPVGLVKKRAYIFDGLGNFYNKDWDLAELYQTENKETDVTDVADGRGNEFSWYHVEIPKGNQRPSQSAQDLISILCPPLKLQDILSLVSNGPFCAHVDGALVFRVNSPGPPTSDFTFRLSARITKKSVITVSLGRVPRLGFSRQGESLLSEVPSVESSSHFRGQQQEGSGTVIMEHVLEFLLTMNHSEEADNPKQGFCLIVGGYALKKQMLDDRRFPKLHINLQRLLQVIAHGEQVYLRVKEKCSSKRWFANEDINSLEELIGRLRRLKENVGFIANRVTAVQASLDSWQSEQINRKLYYLSFLSIIFLPLSIITGVFGMNVGGVPWTGQNAPELQDGFRNVMLLCVAMLFLVLLCFIFPTLYTRVAVAWQKRKSPVKSWSLNRKSFLKRPLRIGEQDRGGYLRI
ncbi:hypothetical protein PIB30_015942 [Stylosanthes scabra]|uniref:Zinc transport protein ZntB n=1 Tax=Stylosanthes scabra TaxID=79078 RepID=A0ABU6V746_9FABA|nr:hypothetical protein [Stylosanthes scabra]